MSEIWKERYFETPVGRMRGLASESGLHALEYVGPVREKLLSSRLTKWFASPEIETGWNDALERTAAWLDAYFEGHWQKLALPPIDARGTEFEKRVWRTLHEIPLGATWTYGQVATRVGIPKGARAAGGASRRNPISLIVPCHRVIGSSGALTGYGGGMPNKEWLLAHERGQ